MQLNKVQLSGNLTRDPEIRFTSSGTAVCDISIAVNRRYKSGEETKEEVTFVDVTFWAKTAEIVGKYFTKGKPIYIEGRLEMDTWEDKQTGAKRSKLKVTGENFQFFPGSASDSPKPPTPKTTTRRTAVPAMGGDDDDIPF